jgi:hypothetical protein
MYLPTWYYRGYYVPTYLVLPTRYLVSTQMYKFNKCGLCSCTQFVPIIKVLIRCFGAGFFF